MLTTYYIWRLRRVRRKLKKAKAERAALLRACSLETASAIDQEKARKLLELSRERIGELEIKEREINFKIDSKHLHPV